MLNTYLITWFLQIEKHIMILIIQLRKFDAEVNIAIQK